MKTERNNLPEDVRSFIYIVTLFLQASRSKTPEQSDRMFQRAYKLYDKYDVEGRRKSISFTECFAEIDKQKGGKDE